MSIKNYSTTAASNTSSPPNGCPEGWALSDINNTMRQVMADVRTLAASNTIASATTCDLGSLDETFLTVSGTTTITALGTVSAGIWKAVTFSGALILTHNGTSLILPGAANITTVAGDCALFLSLGSGNWKCMFYQVVTAASYQPLDATLTALASSLTAANKIPYATALNTLGELTRSTDGTLAGNSDTNIPTEKAVKTYVTTAVAAVSSITAGTAQASTSGTTLDFTGIASTAKRITLIFSGFSTNGSSLPIVQLGDSGGFEATGYLGGAGSDGLSVNSTVGFPIAVSTAASYVHHGMITLVKLDGNTWVSSGSSARSDLAAGASFGGSKTLSATLTQVRLTTEGADTFDAGSVNILVE